MIPLKLFEKFKNEYVIITCLNGSTFHGKLDLVSYNDFREEFKEYLDFKLGESMIRLYDDHFDDIENRTYNYISLESVCSLGLYEPSHKSAINKDK